MAENLGFYYRHCAKCGRRICTDKVRCAEHKIEDYGKAEVRTIDL